MRKPPNNMRPPRSTGTFRISCSRRITVSRAAIWREYKDAESLAKEAAEAIFGGDSSDDIDQVMSISEDQLAQRVRITERRNNMTEGRIAVGFYHTVALRSDGTVLACGSNDFGQCDVSDWSDVVSVDAGAYFTVGLKKRTALFFSRDWTITDRAARPGGAASKR